MTQRKQNNNPETAAKKSAVNERNQITAKDTTTGETATAFDAGYQSGYADGYKHSTFNHEHECLLHRHHETCDKIKKLTNEIEHLNIQRACLEVELADIRARINHKLQYD